MMHEAMACGVPMMIGMVLVSMLLIGTFVLTSAAAIRYLRAADADEGRRLDD